MASLRYWDVVFQTVDRLNLILQYFAQQEPTFGKVEVMSMRNFQGDIQNFMKGAGGEKARIMVTHSGVQPEGGRKVSDFRDGIDNTTIQRIEHGIEVHICTKQMSRMSSDDPNEMTSLGLEWVVTEALRGLHIYARLPDGTVDLNNPLSRRTSGNGMLHIETLPDRDYDGALFSTARFQVMEVVIPMSNMGPEQIWGVYQEIMLSEYPAAIGGQTPQNPTETTIVD